MSEDKFSELFKYMQKGFSDVEKSFVGVDERFGDLINLINNFADNAGVDLDKVRI